MPKKTTPQPAIHPDIQAAIDYGIDLDHLRWLQTLSMADRLRRNDEAPEFFKKMKITSSARHPL